MFRAVLPRATPRAALRAGPKASNFAIPTSLFIGVSKRGYAAEAGDHDLVIIGGGVAGYVAAIKAGQEGLKVGFTQIYKLAGLPWLGTN
jgi:dihydrolipoamide dehydrogenase